MMRHSRILPALALLTGAALAGCSGTPDDGRSGTDATRDALPADHPPIQGAAAPGRAGGPPVVVKETLEAGGYTYALVESGGEEMWSAGPTTELAVGDTVYLTDPMPMRNFHSNTLDRDFDAILFVGGFAAADEAPPPPQGTAGEVLHSGGYTYVQVEMDDGTSQWMAGPRTAMEEGDVVSWSGGMPMTDFTSSTLERTFEEILFVDGLRVVN